MSLVRRLAQRRPLVAAAWIALKVALVVATMAFLADHGRAAIVYQRF